MQSSGLRTNGTIKQSQENMPFITVITVVRNGEKTLEETILSVINQTYKNIEYIIIDGGSTDNTLEIIKKYDDKIDYWLSEPDDGIYYAMNKGIGLATGKWINFMNSGDAFFDNTIIEKVFKQNRASDIIYGNALYKTKKFSEIRYPENIRNLSKRMVFTHQSSFIRTSLVKTNGFNTKYRIAADFELLYRLYCTGCVFEYINLIIATWEAETGLSSMNPEKGFMENLTVIEEKWCTLKNIKVLVSLIIKKNLKKILPYYIVHFLKYKFRSLKALFSLK
jgi:glycosyltransferase involved in cell wall biosynthesis